MEVVFIAVPSTEYFLNVVSSVVKVPNRIWVDGVINLLLLFMYFKMDNLKY